MTATAGESKAPPADLPDDYRIETETARAARLTPREDR